MAKVIASSGVGGSVRGSGGRRSSFAGGAGTGKLTRLLVRAFGRVVAVEPAEAMRRLLAPLCPDAEPLAGTAQEIPAGREWPQRLENVIADDVARGFWNAPRA